MEIEKKILSMGFDDPVSIRQRFILIDVAKSETPYTKGTAEIAKVIGATKSYTSRAVRALVDRGFLNRKLELGEAETKRTLTISEELKERIKTD